MESATLNLKFCTHLVKNYHKKKLSNKNSKAKQERDPKKENNLVNVAQNCNFYTHSVKNYEKNSNLSN